MSTGPYAVCRHPLYWASFLIALSLAAFMASLSILVAVIALGFVYAVAVIPSEERHAIACFGDAYQAYMRRTPGLMPRWCAIERPGTIEIKVAAFLRECAPRLWADRARRGHEPPGPLSRATRVAGLVSSAINV